MDMAAIPTAEALPTASGDTTALEMPTAKEPLPESVPQDQARVKSEAVIPVIWQIILLALGLVSGLMMFLLRRSAAQKWK